MPEPKKPQDHRSKQGTVTVSGITLTIPPDRLSDWDVVEGIATMQDDTADQGQKVVATVRVMRILLGGDYERVKTDLRAANEGRLDAAQMTTFLTKVFEELNPPA